MTTAHLISPEELMAFLDGELAPPRAAIVRAHVDGCRECAATAEESRVMSHTLREWRVEPAPVTLTAPSGAGSAFAPSETVTRPARDWSRTLVRATPWLAAAAVVALGTYVVMPGPRRMSAVAVGGPASGQQSATAGSLDYNEGLLPPALRGSVGAKKAYDGLKAPTARDAGALAASVPAPALLPPPPQAAPSETQGAPEARMIVRTATLGLSTDRFDDVLRRMQTVAGQHGGTVSAYQAAGSEAEGRSLSATVRVPIETLDATLQDLRALGTVTGESQATEEITDAHRDLAIRIANAQREAARLNDLLTRQSDRLSDVLAVEQAQARVQTDIEQMTAEETAMRGRAAMSSIAISVMEIRHAQLALGPLPIRTRLHNALVDGLRTAAESAVATVLALMSVAPSLLLWFVMVAPPAAFVWWAVRAFQGRRALR